MNRALARMPSRTTWSQPCRRPELPACVYAQIRFYAYVCGGFLSNNMILALRCMPSFNVHTSELVRMGQSSIRLMIAAWSLILALRCLIFEPHCPKMLMCLIFEPHSNANRCRAFMCMIVHTCTDAYILSASNYRFRGFFASRHQKDTHTHTHTYTHTYIHAHAQSINQITSFQAVARREHGWDWAVPKCMYVYMIHLFMNVYVSICCVRKSLFEYHECVHVCMYVCMYVCTTS
jgi:hypothetical protein